MINKLLAPFGLKVRRLSSGGRLEELRLSLRAHGRLDLTVVETEIEGVSVRFAVHSRDDHIQRHHFRGAFYEQEGLALIAHHFQGGTFVDVGANVGNHVIYAGKFLRADRVIAFEPGHRAATILRCNVGLNDLGSVVEVRELALSDVEGRARLDDSVPDNLGAAKLRSETPGPISLMRGDDALAGEQVGFLKIDTEGSELRVLEGLKNTLATQRPTVFVEVEDESAGAVSELFRNLGYEVKEKLPNYSGMANWIVVPG